MKILIIQPYRLGDVLQATPALQALKIKYKDVKIDFVVDSSCAGAIAGNPYVSRLIVLPRNSIRKSGARDIVAGFRELYAFMGEILQTRYDLAINYNFDAIGGILLKECAAAEKRGLIFSGGKFEMNDPWTKYLFAIITSRRYSFINISDIFKLIAGVGDIRSSLYFKIKAGGRSAGKFLDFAFDRPVVTVQGFASRMERSLSAEQNTELISMLSKKYNVALLGAKGEEHFMPGLKDTDSFRNLTGKTTLDELAGVIKSSSLLITPDTFAMHAAAAVGTKTAGIFKAGAWPYETAPYAAGVKVIFAPLECAPCAAPENCRGMKCGAAITPEFLSGLVENIIENRPAANPDGIDVYESNKGNFLYFDAGHREAVETIISANGLISRGKTPIIPVKRNLQAAVGALLSSMRTLENDLKRDSAGIH
jgi:ADP-heptose:LPS heptosyltransferase